MSFGLFDMTAQRAALSPDRPAMEDLTTGLRVTYGALDRRTCSFAGVLREAGVGHGDRVAILCRNRIAFFEGLFACAKLGAIFVPLNWRMPPAELDPLLKDCAPKLLIYGREDEDCARQLAGPFARLGLDDPGPDGFEARKARAQAVEGRAHWPAEEAWYLLYTSGTTGVPKAVIQTYGMALANYVNTRQAIDLREDETTLNFLPLFHTAGINLFTLPALFAGGTVLVLPGFDPDTVMALLASDRIDTFFAVPAVYQALSLHAGFDSADLGAIRIWGCGGAPLPDSLVARYGARGVKVQNGYGMTETGPTALFTDAASMTAKIGSIGKPQLLVSARIVRADGSDAAVDEPGEIWLSGPAITPGYWNRPDMTAAAFAPGGWLKTGDVARRDADGYYYIEGRIKEMYISGGENVYPVEVENVLALHPDILEAAVVGVPDDRWGEVGRAYVLPRPGVAPDLADLERFCRERLAAYKVPRFFTVVEDFPRTASGKIQKQNLTDPD